MSKISLTSLRTGQITLFSLFPHGLTSLFPKSQRSANDWLKVSISPSLPRSMGCQLLKSNTSRRNCYTEWNRNSTVKIHEKNSVTQLLLPSFAKHLFQAIIHHKRPPPKPWCASDSVHSRGLDGGGGGETEVPGCSTFYPEEGRPNGNQFVHWSTPSLPEPLDLSQWSHEVSLTPKDSESRYD